MAAKRLSAVSAELLAHSRESGMEKEFMEATGRAIAHFVADFQV